MRSLDYVKYGVIALSPLLGAAGFAQGLNLGMNGGVIVQAQAPAQPAPYGTMNGSGKPETVREPGVENAGTPMGREMKLDPPVSGAADTKTTPRAQAKTQPRKGEKKSKETDTN